MLELARDGTKDQKEDDIGRLFMLTFNGDPDIANDLACLNLDINGRGVACIKMSHDSEGMHVINVASSLDTCCEASVMNQDLFNRSFRDTGAVVSYTSLRNKALQAAEGSNLKVTDSRHWHLRLRRLLFSRCLSI